MGGAMQGAVDDLIPAVYQELRRIARAHLRRERIGHTLNTTALVHEAYVELARFDQALWGDRAHFLSIAARMMRRVLIDYAVAVLRAAARHHPGDHSGRPQGQSRDQGSRHVG
jgi:RNA polymerase sigma factor (TIGR02999 family)